MRALHENRLEGGVVVSLTNLRTQVAWRIVLTKTTRLSAMYLHAGDVIHRIILYYILPRDSALDFESVRDIVTRLPLKDYAIVIQRDRCELALEFLAPYTINDPTILEIKGTGAKVYANDVPDIFEKIRDFGPPFGSYRYNTVSFLGEHSTIQQSRVINVSDVFWFQICPRCTFLSQRSMRLDHPMVIL